MPTYRFYNKDTKEEFETVLRISELDEYKRNRPELEQRVTGVLGYSDPARLGLAKPATGFRDLLKNMKTKHRGSTINDF